MTAPDLLARTAELIDIPSVSHDEAAITDHIAALFDGLDGSRLDRVGRNLVARTNFGHPQRLAAGRAHRHRARERQRRRPASRATRCSDSARRDMKGGLAVFLELALAVGRGEITPTVDLTFVFYACEEVARDRQRAARTFRVAARPHGV